MTTKKDAAPEVTPKEIDPAKAEQQALARKAYGEATQQLRETYRLEFDRLLTARYEALGVNVRRRASAEEIAQRKAAHEAEVKARASARKAAKAAKLQAELDALNFEIAVEDLATADQVPVDPSFIGA